MPLQTLVPAKTLSEVKAELTEVKLAFQQSEYMGSKMLHSIWPLIAMESSVHFIELGDGMDAEQKANT